MKEGLDVTLVNTDAFLKRGYSFLASNAGKTIALITLIVAALVSFTDIAFSGISAEGFTSTLAMLLIASYIMYFSLEDAGEGLGKSTEEYKNALSAYKEARQAVDPSDIEALRAFCLKYREKELIYRKNNRLFSHGYTPSDLERYKRDEITDKRMRLELGKIDREAPIDLSAQALLKADSSKSVSEFKSPEKGKLLSMLLRLIPSTVCMFFTVSVMVSAKENLDTIAVIGALLKLSALPIMGLKGYSAGYRYASTSLVEWLNTKAELLRAFKNSERSDDVSHFTI